MSKAQSGTGEGGAPDVLVIGGGAFGLWCARAAVEAGLSVTLAEAAEIGAGASATPVGALAPHDPVGWSPLKALQLDGLLRLPGEIAALEAETGCATGYARHGRLALSGDGATARAAEKSEAAAAAWGGAGEVRAVADPSNVPPALAGLVAQEALMRGAVFDTLSARIDPPRYIQALAASLRGRARVLEGWRAQALLPGAVRFDRGTIAAGAVVVASGWGAPALAEVARGRGVKGQAAVLDAHWPADVPIITRPGLYVVRHDGGVAVGATSEPDRTDTATDEGLDPVIALARETCPDLAGAPVVRRWAGVRPRGPKPWPIVGPVPDRDGVWLAAGGFKIGLALAHLAGRAVVAEILGDAAPVPMPAQIAPDRQLGEKPVGVQGRLGLGLPK